MSVEVPTMRIVINGQEGLASVEPGARLGNILDEVRQWLVASRVAILEMRLDGSVLEPGRQQALRFEPTEAYQLLEIDVCEVGILAREVLGSIRAHLPPISQRLVEITTRLQSGESGRAFTLLDDVLEAWGLVLEAIENLRRLYGVVEVSIQRIDEILKGKEVSLRRLLEEIREALQDRDLVTVGDCLEYELSPMVTDWSEVVDALEEVLGSAPEDRGA